MSSHPLEDILHPRSIAVVGASDSGRGGGFVKPLQELGFKGDIYPVNPNHDEVMGLKAYASVKDIPGHVDFVISSIPASKVLDMIKDCAEKSVKGIHLFTARFSETGRTDAAELEREILAQARKGGMRLIGPNCMGVYYPAHGLAFGEGMPRESGGIGLASQSGGAVGEIVGFAAQRGVRFSKAISYGNALDFNECDYIDYFAQDPQTKVLLLYIEGVRDGKRFLDSLQKAARVKPVVVIKGGRGEAGGRATASHTSSMAGSRRIWESLTKQAGVITATDIDELVDIAVALNYLPPVKGRHVGVVGGSGGGSVLAADLCEEAGLNVIPLPENIRQELRKQGSPIWDWVGNPVDFSIGFQDYSESMALMNLMADHPDFDFLMVFVHGPWHLDSEPFNMEKHLEPYLVHKKTGKPAMVIFGNRPRGRGSEAEALAKISTAIEPRLIAENLPVYPNIGRAARTIKKIIEYYENKNSAP